MNELKFIDLFAGLGGFHKGLSNAGGYKCVFASEIDPRLRELYKVNYGHYAEGDITEVATESVPAHDVLCAGFPCQPFSLAGQKKGAGCKKSGMLVEHVIRIAAHRKPEFLILENVPGLRTASNGSVWQYVINALTRLGYNIVHKVISPIEIGVPQNRKRLFVVASMNYDLTSVFAWAAPMRAKQLGEFLDNASRPYKRVEPNKKFQLHKWQELLTDCVLPSVMPIQSIVAPEFGATYPLDFSKNRLRDLRNFRGAYGRLLGDCVTWSELLAKMPSYCRKHRKVPIWLKQSVGFSRGIYLRNSEFLNKWHVDLDKQYNSWQLLEWRGDRKCRLLSQHIIQFRASGIRVAKSSTVPSLVAMTVTQVPIIGSEMRYLSKREAARLQNLHDLKEIPGGDSFAFKAIGNSVNASIVMRIASNINRIRSSNNPIGDQI